MVSPDKITQGQTLFAYGSISRRKRQTDDGCVSFDSCGDVTIPPTTIADVNVTDDQRDMCDNDDTCLFDLAVTGDEDLAMKTLETSVVSARQQMIISKNLTVISIIARE